MRILHLTPHMGGGVGSVIMGWMDRVIAANDYDHQIISLDHLNPKVYKWAYTNGFPITGNGMEERMVLDLAISRDDIVLVHYWDHPMLADLFSEPIPDCRLVFWCHKNYDVPGKVVSYPDRFFDTSPIQNHGAYIWSTGGVDRFLEIQPKPHEGFNVGYVGTVDWKKIHSHFFVMCDEIMSRIPDARFTVVGEGNITHAQRMGITFTGHVDDVAPYLAEMDVFGYPLRPDHYGTCEQVLGEAMAAGVVPVVMNNPAVRTIIEDNVNGYIADNESDYIACIKWLYHNPDARKGMAHYTRNDAKYLYSLEAMMAAWDNVFYEMMKEPKRSRGVL
jgi:glycosyltransferase involved in cell wall biosynthesis